MFSSRICSWGKLFLWNHGSHLVLASGIARVELAVGVAAGVLSAEAVAKHEIVALASVGMAVAHPWAQRGATGS